MIVLGTYFMNKSGKFKKKYKEIFSLNRLDTWVNSKEK